VPAYQHGLANSYIELGNIQLQAGEVLSARDWFEKAIARFEALVAAHPGVPD
jgi:Tfp pilus assembly protein PilF